MALTLMPVPAIQFIGADRTPLAGGYLYTYENLTVTPKATYTDASGTFPNLNPIQLDAAGSAVVWLDGVYSMKLTDAVGNLVDQWDNIVAGDQTQFAALQSQINAVTPAPTGTVAFFAQNYSGGSALPPIGWLQCDGSAISRSIYATLFALIGTTYGTGDGVSTFNLPNTSGTYPALAINGGGTKSLVPYIKY